MTDNNNEDKRDRFDDFGEEVGGYISLEQARLVAIQHALDTPDFHGSQYSEIQLAWGVTEAHEGEDFYYITLSFRPSGRFSGDPGVEQFTIDKLGQIQLRQLVSELLPKSETGVPNETPQRHMPFFRWIIGLAGVAAVVAAIVVVAIAIQPSLNDPAAPLLKPTPTFPPTPTLTVPPTTPAAPTPVLPVLLTASPRPAPTVAVAAAPTALPPPINITIASSITKWEWLEEAVRIFNEASETNPDLRFTRRPIHVEVLLEEDPLTGRLRHFNSGTQVKDTLTQDIQPTILSPASTHWIRWLNKEWESQHGKEITTGPWDQLLSTPVVVAMWESRATALGCWPTPDPNCTWGRLRDLAASPEGWGMIGHPEWGEFHFGYAYVGESDVGTQTAVLLCMMGLQQNTDLDVTDIKINNGCGEAISDVEKAIAHRGTSSPLILDSMQRGGSAFLDAVTTYEKNVIGFNSTHQTSDQLVSVYPQDGTVIADHPFAIMDRADWVTTSQVEAAKIFRSFLLSLEQQQAFLPFGLRPSTNFHPDSPIDLAHGANPAANLVTLDTPDVLVVDQVINVWLEVKKPANIVMAFDKSGSMEGEKITQARNGAVEFVGEMGRKDWLLWLPFDGKYYPGSKGLVSDIGEQLKKEISLTPADGETALYDAIARAYEELESQREESGDEARYGIVVLSDGQDTRSETTLAMLETMLRPREGDQAGIQVHTIGIGDNADDQVLTKIANFTHGGRYWKVNDTTTIDAVYRRISKYF